MHDFTILVLPGAHASGVAVTLDVLQAATQLAPRLRTPRPGWRLLSPEGGMVTLSSGMQVATRVLPMRPRAEASTWIIPGLAVDQPDALAQRTSGDRRGASSCRAGRYRRGVVFRGVPA
jgi:transcriptional regulator GlxA family with amidase domain